MIVSGSWGINHYQPFWKSTGACDEYVVRRYVKHCKTMFAKVRSLVRQNPHQIAGANCLDPVSTQPLLHTGQALRCIPSCNRTSNLHRCACVGDSRSNQLSLLNQTSIKTAQLIHQFKMKLDYVPSKGWLSSSRLVWKKRFGGQ